MIALGARLLLIAHPLLVHKLRRPHMGRENDQQGGDDNERKWSWGRDEGTNTLLALRNRTPDTQRHNAQQERQKNESERKKV